MFKNFIDISWPIQPGMTQYKNRSQFSLLQTKRMDVDACEEHCLVMNLHAGTHIDAPAHMLASGDAINALAPEKYCGKALVADLSNVTDKIEIADLERLPLEENIILLCKTSNSTLAPTAPFNPNFVYLSAKGAEFLAQKKIKTFGLDYLGIERGAQSPKAHQTFFNAGIGVLEGLRLANVAEGWYTLICLSLALKVGEAAPARAFLAPANVTHYL